MARAGDLIKSKRSVKWPGWHWVADALRTLSPLPLTFAATGLTLILWLGDWPVETAEQRIRWLGISLVCTIALLGLALFLVREGIRSFSVKAGAVEIGINDETDDDK